MTVKELKAILKDARDEMQVLIPVSREFDGFFYSPCPAESGVCQVDMGKEPEPIYQTPTEEALTKQPEPEATESDVFMLVPCGFGGEKEEHHEHLMN